MHSQDQGCYHNFKYSVAKWLSGSPLGGWQHGPMHMHADGWQGTYLNKVHTPGKAAGNKKHMASIVGWKMLSPIGHGLKSI